MGLGPKPILQKAHNVDSERMSSQSPFIICLNRNISEMLPKLLQEHNIELPVCFMTFVTNTQITT